jgi:hypothetical protein
MRAAIPLALVALSGCSPDPCSDVGDTCIGVTAQGSFDIDQLRVELLGSGLYGNKLVPDAPQPASLPQSVSIEIKESVSGQLGVNVTALLGSAVEATGSTVVQIQTGQHVDATVTLTKGGGTFTPIALTQLNKADLLFMVDNSPSMAPKQAELQARFPDLIKILDDFGITTPM